MGLPRAKFPRLRLMARLVRQDRPHAHGGLPNRNRRALAVTDLCVLDVERSCGRTARMFFALGLELWSQSGPFS